MMHRALSELAYFLLRVLLWPTHSCCSNILVGCADAQTRNARAGKTGRRRRLVGDSSCSRSQQRSLVFRALRWSRSPSDFDSDRRAHTYITHTWFSKRRNRWSICAINRAVMNYCHSMFFVLARQTRTKNNSSAVLWVWSGHERIVWLQRFQVCFPLRFLYAVHRME